VLISVLSRFMTPFQGVFDRDGQDRDYLTEMLALDR
jgi:hypothetical protein